MSFAQPDVFQGRSHMSAAEFSLGKPWKAVRDQRCFADLGSEWHLFPWRMPNAEHIGSAGQAKESAVTFHGELGNRFAGATIISGSSFDPSLILKIASLAAHATGKVGTGMFIVQRGKGIWQLEHGGR